MAIPLLVAIDVPREVSANILRLRKFIVTRVGKDIYGSAAPNVTLFVNSFSNFNEVDKQLVQTTKKFKPFPLKVDGVHVFKDDPILKAHTVVYKLEKSAQLSKLHKEVVESLARLRTDDQAKWIFEQNPKMPQANKENLKRYGYPFGPEDSVLHASIGSYPAEKHTEIWKKAQQFDLTKKWAVASIAVYMVTDSGVKVLRTYKSGG